MYYEFNNEEKEKLNRVYLSFKGYMLETFDVSINNIKYLYSEENPYIKMNIKTTEEFNSFITDPEHRLRGAYMDTTKKSSVCVQFNKLLIENDLGHIATDKIKIIVFDQEAIDKANALSKLIRYLNRNNGLFLELEAGKKIRRVKKYTFAEGYIKNQKLVQLVLLYDKMKYYKKAIKNYDFKRLKDEYYKILKEYDTNDCYEKEEFQLYVIYNGHGGKYHHGEIYIENPKRLYKV